jgi:hypothetical protein
MKHHRAQKNSLNLGDFLLDLKGAGEGLVSSCFFWGLQQTPTLQTHSVGFDQSVLSRMLASRITAGHVYKGRSRLQKCDEE